MQATRPTTSSLQGLDALLDRHINAAGDHAQNLATVIHSHVRGLLEEERRACADLMVLNRSQILRILGKASERELHTVNAILAERSRTILTFSRCSTSFAVLDELLEKWVSAAAGREQESSRQSIRDHIAGMVQADRQSYADMMLLSHSELRLMGGEMTEAEANAVDAVLSDRNRMILAQPAR